MGKPLHLSGKLFRIEMTYNDLCDAEEYMSKGCLKVATDGDLGFKDLRGLLFAAVRGQHGIQTPEDAGRLIEANAGRFVEIVEVFSDILGRAFPQETDDEGNPTEAPMGAPGAGNGKASTALPTALSTSAPVISST